MKQQLPEEALQNLNVSSKAGREAWKNGDTKGAEHFFLEAWAAIPEPKNEYDYTQSLSRGFVAFYLDTKQFEKAKEWLNLMRIAYGHETVPSEYVDFIAATVYFEAGEFDSAFRIFDAQFKKYKGRPFQGEDKKYLDFYKKRATEG